MSTSAAARSLYEAINARDPNALRNAMADDFVGDVSAGMPLGVGGRHEGPDAMLTEVWIPVFGRFEVSLDVDELLEAGDETIVALGSYRGSDRRDGRSFSARFAHVLEVRGGRVRRLEQITDTRSWPDDGSAPAR